MGAAAEGEGGALDQPTSFWGVDANGSLTQEPPIQCDRAVRAQLPGSRRSKPSADSKPQYVMPSE